MKYVLGGPCVCHTTVYARMVAVAAIISVMLCAIKYMGSAEENIIFSAYNQLVRFQESLGS
jgi:hypothetical protein